MLALSCDEGGATPYELGGTGHLCCRRPRFSPYSVPYVRLLFVSGMKKGGFTPPNGGVKLPFCQLLLRQFFFQAGEDFFLFARDLDLRQSERLGGLLLGVFPIETENHDFPP